LGDVPSDVEVAGHKAIEEAAKQNSGGFFDAKI
jgi:hypothetical protein